MQEFGNIYDTFELENAWYPHPLSMDIAVCYLKDEGSFTQTLLRHDYNRGQNDEAEEICFDIDPSKITENESLLFHGLVLDDQDVKNWLDNDGEHPSRKNLVNVALKIGDPVEGIPLTFRERQGTVNVPPSMPVGRLRQCFVSPDYESSLNLKNWVTFGRSR